MGPVTLKTLEDVKTLHEETLLVLLRFYLNVDRKIPNKHLPLLLGESDYCIDRSPKSFSEFFGQCAFALFRSTMPAKDRNMFMIQNSKKQIFITTHTKKALNEYLRKYKPLPKALIYTNKEWQETEAFKNRFCAWGSFF